MGILRWLGPLIAQVIVLYCYFCAIINYLLWLEPKSPKTDDRPFSAKLELLIFTFIVFQIQLNFFTAIVRGPGFVPKNWRPKNKNHENFLQFCKQCDGFKAPRSHHCRRTNRCVLKMDHYCPWIGQCVGHYNHACFVRFLFFVCIGCPWSIYIIVAASYKQIYTPWHELYNTYGRNHTVFTSKALLFNFIGFGGALGTTIAVGFLLYQQIKIIISNKTSCEKWICAKACDRERLDNEPEFIYPYDLGKWENFKFVFGKYGLKMGVSCSGMTDWPVVENTGQFTLTVEQLAQKAFKKAMTQYGIAVKAYSGWWIPIFGYGCCIGCFRVPKTDENRLRLMPGDELAVTRCWGDHWWYGEVVKFVDQGLKVDKLTRSKVRGWFPASAIELGGGMCGHNENEKNQSSKDK